MISVNNQVYCDLTGSFFVSVECIYTSIACKFAFELESLNFCLVVFTWNISMCVGVYSKDIRTCEGILYQKCRKILIFI